jgi:ABC-type sugar transport system ATPase subunit
MVELRAVSKRFGTNFAVKNLSFDCKEREFMVIFGPAGAGKSTTLKLIAGIMHSSYGEIWFRGKSMEGIPPEKRNTSMVFENYALYSHLTVFENLAFPLRARKLPEVEVKKRVLDMAEVLNMSSMLDRRPGFLSGGQRQRVALGRGLIREADIYLLDEPISHLDARLRIQMRAELKNICLEKQSTVLHVTHDYREAMALADRVAVLNKGTLMQIGAPEDVYLNPANEFVASFVGDPPMSFIAVNITAKDDRPAFHIRSANVTIPSSADFDHQAASKAKSCIKLLLGIRANQTSLSSKPDARHNVPVLIYLIEVQGHRNLVTVKLGEDIIQIDTPRDSNWSIGERAWMSMQPSSLHVFADGQAIYHPKTTNET